MRLHGNLPLVAGEKITKALKLSLAGRDGFVGSFRKG